MTDGVAAVLSRVMDALDAQPRGAWVTTALHSVEAVRRGPHVRVSLAWAAGGSAETWSVLVDPTDYPWPRHLDTALGESLARIEARRG